MQLKEFLDKTKMPICRLASLSDTSAMNIHNLLKPRIGKELYTKSCWADITGLYKATLYDENMTIKIGNELRIETLKKRGNLGDDTYSWLTNDKIFVDENTF